MMRDIGKNIRLAREKKGYSQEQLAALLFVTRQTVSNYETGRSRPDVETLAKLAELLDTEVTELIYGPEPPKPRKSFWAHLALSIVLLVLYLWLTPLSVSYARRYYVTVPYWFCRTALFPCVLFSFGHLLPDALAYFRKPKPIAHGAALRAACFSWIFLYCISLCPTYLSFLLPDFQPPRWWQLIALGILGCDSLAVQSLTAILFFLSGAGLAFAPRKNSTAKKRKWTPEEVRQWYAARGARSYRNPEDGNWVVRKPASLGWTVNLANPKTWYFLAGVLAAILLISLIGNRPRAQSLGIIGGADGPTAVYITGK